LPALLCAEAGAATQQGKRSANLPHPPPPNPLHFTSFASKNTATYENIGKLHNYTLSSFFATN